MRPTPDFGPRDMDRLRTTAERVAAECPQSHREAGLLVLGGIEQIVHMERMTAGETINEFWAQFETEQGTFNIMIRRPDREADVSG